MQSAGWSYYAVLTLTRLAIAAVNSVNCVARLSQNFGERASSLWRNLFRISVGLCPEVARLSGIPRVRGQTQIAQFWHGAVSCCADTWGCSCTRSCAEGALFIARVSVDNLTGVGVQDPFFRLYQSCRGPEFPGVFRGALCGRKNAHCTWGCAILGDRMTRVARKLYRSWRRIRNRSTSYVIRVSLQSRLVSLWNLHMHARREVAVCGCLHRLPLSVFYSFA